MRKVNIQFTKEELVNLIDTIWQGIDHRYLEIGKGECTAERRKGLLQQNKVAYDSCKRLLDILDRNFASEPGDDSSETSL